MLVSKLKKAFDILSFSTLSAGLFLSIFLTKVDIKLLSYALPLIVLVKIFVFKDKISDLLGLENSKSAKKHELIKLVHIALFILVPIVFGFIHDDLNWLVHDRTKWLNYQNIYIVALAYLSSKILIQDSLKILKNNKALITTYLCSLLFISFMLDFGYSIVKIINDGEARWEGSTSNANVWAMQTAMMLLLWYLSKQNFKSNILLKLFHYSLVILIIISIFKAASVANVLGILASISALFIASSAWISLELALIIFLLVILAFNLFILFGSPEIFYSEKKTAISFKVLPRLKLWRHAHNFTEANQVSLIFGAGYQNYIDWLNSLRPKGYYHFHNSFLHYLFQYGLIGLYSAFVYFLLLNQKVTEYFAKLFSTNEEKINLDKLFKIHPETKYYFVIIIYILAASCFDCSFWFFENQMLFWFLVPLIDFICENNTYKH